MALKMKVLTLASHGSSPVGLKGSTSVGSPASGPSHGQMAKTGATKVN